jgi:hypothetical protein
MVVASGWLGWKRRGRVTDGRESILRVHARDLPCGSTASLCLSGYRDAPTVMISQPGPPHRTHPPRSAPLSLSRDRAKPFRPVGQSDWSVPGYTPPPALDNTGRQSRIPERSPWGESSLSLVRSDPSRLSGTADSGKGCSHHFTVDPDRGGVMRLAEALAVEGHPRARTRRPRRPPTWPSPPGRSIGSFAPGSWSTSGLAALSTSGWWT